jgi:HAMP domain-containing protein
VSWLYGQTWLWYLIAFAVGLLLAWHFLVRPQQRRLPAAGPAAAGEPAAKRLRAVDPAADTAEIPVRSADSDSATSEIPIASKQAAPAEGWPRSGAAAASAVAVASEAPVPQGETSSTPPSLFAAGPFPGSAQPAPDGSAPGPQFTIKGIADSMLFHSPDSPHHGQAKAEVWFSTAEEAEEAGFTSWTKR